MTRSNRRGAQPSRQPQVVGDARPAARPLDDDDLVEVRVVANDRLGGGLDEIGEAGVRESLAERGDGRRREHHVADQAQPDEQNVHPSTPLRASPRLRDLRAGEGQGSTVASSISMIGMSSLIG